MKKNDQKHFFYLNEAKTKHYISCFITYRLFYICILFHSTCILSLFLNMYILFYYSS